MPKNKMAVAKDVATKVAVPCAPCEAAKLKREAALVALKERSAELVSDDGTLKIIYKTIGGARVQCGQEEYLFLRDREANADMIAVDVSRECAENYVAASRARFPSADELENLTQYEARRNKPRPAATLKIVEEKPAKKAAKPLAKPVQKVVAKPTPKAVAKHEGKGVQIPASSPEATLQVLPKDPGAHDVHSHVAPKDLPDNLT